MLLLSCFPYAFLAVYGDAEYGTMSLYAVMTAGFAMLVCGSIANNDMQTLWIGNVLTTISSFIFAKISGIEDMDYYFKPFTSYSLIGVISMVVIIIQTLIVKMWCEKNKNRNNEESELK
jgi:hypothetical protein